MKCPRCKSNLKIGDDNLYEENGDFKLDLLFVCENEDCNFKFSQEELFEDGCFQEPLYCDKCSSKAHAEKPKITLKEKYFVVYVNVECECQEIDFGEPFEIEYNYVTDEVLADRGNIGA